MSIPQSQDHARDMRIFISHSTADNVLGLRLAEDLRRMLGDPTSVWYDSSGGLRPGVNWWQTILKEVTERPIFLVIWSPDARDSKWVNDEVDLAWQAMHAPGGKTIIPLIWRPCDMRADLRTRQAISFADPDEYDARFAELLAGLGIATDPSASEMRPAAAPTGAPARASQEAAANGETITSGQPNDLLIFSIDGLWPPIRVPMRGPAVTAGRESGNDVLLADPAVSRFHLRLVRQHASWRVEKLPDARPMYVNGERRETALLGHGDQVVIGGTVLRVEQPAAVANATTVVSTDPRTVLASGLMPDLVVETERFHFTTPLRGDVMSVGRAPESTVVIPSPLVSAHQALIRRLPDGGFEIETPHEARNSFTLGGKSLQPLKRHTLRNGDVLTLGSRAQNQFVSLTYVSAGAAIT